jgi:very-short-patch-repair endonuclease
LYWLREGLKERGRAADGRAPTVCTNEALYEIARLKPRSREEFRCVKGLNTAFVEKYADAFLKVVLKRTQKDAPAARALTLSTRDVLKELEKKLINVNRRNRLLYMGKLYPKYACDLYDENGKYDPTDILFTKKDVRVCSAADKGARGQSGEDKYKRLVALLREAAKDRREKGQSGLYAAYPFVKGRLNGENFDVRAPLALFPVLVTREPGYISVKLDEARDAVYNNNLILAQFKFGGKNAPLPNNIVEDVSRAGFMNALLKFYAANGIELKTEPPSPAPFALAGAPAPVSSAPAKFAEYAGGKFPAFKSGELFVEYNAVLGNFPAFSSVLQKDFVDIAENGQINPFLDELLSGIGVVDYYGDAGTAAEPDAPVSEHDLTYIGDLNGSQENVLTAVKKRDALVVQGPPGTGKSQTIASLIADFAHAGKNVLMVSEKKAALDVVYSRLGKLNKYALLIDDTNDKQAFYAQVARALSLPALPENDGAGLLIAADGVDSRVKILQGIADKLYSAKEHGIEIYKLYLTNRRIDPATAEGKRKYEALKARVSAEAARVLQMKFPVLQSCYQKFRDKRLLRDAYSLVQITFAAPWIGCLKDKLTEYELADCRDRAAEVDRLADARRRQNALKRFFSKNKAAAALKSLAAKYCTELAPAHKKNILRKGMNADILKRYAEYRAVRAAYETLSGDEAAYFDALLTVGDVLYPDFRYKNETPDLAHLNEELFNFTVCDFLYGFEVENRGALFQIDNFRECVGEIARLIAQKKTLTAAVLDAVLRKNLDNLVASKRQGEIARICENKRKWAVKKFVAAFAFELFRGIKIWLMTPEAVSELLPLETGLFDLLIFDEASQMYVEKGVPAIFRAKKVVIAGDSKQLRPSSLGAGRIEYDEELDEDNPEPNAALEEESLLDTARFRYPAVTLNYHYRSQFEELIAFSNYAFYKGGLYVSPNTGTPARPPIEVVRVPDGLWTKRRDNRAEAREILKLLKSFLAERKHAETVGIITFNSAQRDLIEDLIDEESKKDPAFAAAARAETVRKSGGEDVGLFVKNIENVQGDERDMIMFSIGYAKNESGRLIKNYGWLNQKGGENRLNVAISRAKRKVIVVTSFDPAELDVRDAQNDGPRILKKYLEYAAAVSRGDRAAAKEILRSICPPDDALFRHAESVSGRSEDSLPHSERSEESQPLYKDFAGRVYDALVRKGFEVDRDIGIGGYSIDLAIKRDEKYVLGIECDGKLYGGAQSTRERDYHRQKYLESRNWKIRRVWSSDWWRDPEKEIGKITDAVK